MTERIDPATGKRWRRPIVNLVNLKIGDVLKSRAGTLRVIREMRQAPRHTYGGTTLTFTIKHCSWTGRPVTVYTIRELEQLGYTKVGLCSRMDRELDARIAAEIGTATRSDLTCCDVRGIA